MTFQRGNYFFAYGCFSTFFITHLILERLIAPESDQSLSKSVIFAVMCLTFFILRIDRPYLIKSMQLRIMIGICGSLSLIVLLNIIG